MPNKAPNVVTIRGAVVTPTTGSALVVCGRSPIAGSVTAVRVFPTVAQAAHDTNKHALALVNKGTAGIGTTEAAAGTTAITGGVGAFVAFDQFDLTLDSTVADRVVAAGDLLVIVDTIGGTVTANHLTAEVDITRTP